MVARDEGRRASQVALMIRNPPSSAGDIGDCRFDPWVGEIPREGNGNPLQHSCLENPMDRSLADYSPWSCEMSDTTEVT